MPTRLRHEQGQGMIEMIVTMVVITIALLALAAGYDAGFLSLHNSARTSAAANLAEQQLELFNTMQYTQIGLDTTRYNAVKAADTRYASDDGALTGNPVTTTCGAYAFCKPVQCTTCTNPVPKSDDPLGSDGRRYKVETFTHTVSHTLWTGSVATTNEIIVTVIVRDPNLSSTPIVYQASAGFDCGQRTGSCT